MLKNMTEILRTTKKKRTRKRGARALGYKRNERMNKCTNRKCTYSVASCAAQINQTVQVREKSKKKNMTLATAKLFVQCPMKMAKKAHT